MFSENWDFKLFNKKADQIIERLETEGVATRVSTSRDTFPLPVTSNVDAVENFALVCSGYPEHAGVWSYTLLEKGLRDPDGESNRFIETSMEDYFRAFNAIHVGLAVVNPHAEELKAFPDQSLPIYLLQLKRFYDYFTYEKDGKFVLIGFSLGGEAILRFLQNNPEFLSATRGIVFIDPVPPSMSRKKLIPELSELLNRALFFGMSDSNGNPSDYTRYTERLLAIRPELFPCTYHGEMPHRVRGRLLDRLPAFFE